MAQPKTLEFGVNLNNREPLIAPGYGIPQLLDLSETVEGLGFDSIWLFDHVQTEPVPTDEITFEAFVGLSALAAETARLSKVIKNAKIQLD